MLKTNVEKLIETAVCGQVAHPTAPKEPAWKIGHDGSAYLPVTGAGINYTVRVGDPAFGWAWGDHVEPGVSVSHPCPEANAALNTYACIGNEAVLIDAKMEAKDAKLKGSPGVVVGKRQSGGEERLLVHFPRRVVDRLCVGDTIQIRAVGVGLQISGYADVAAMNLSPRLLKALNPSEKAGKLRIPVAKIVLGKIIGSGVGAVNAFRGDFDIQCTSSEAMKDYSLDALRLGDVVAITDTDTTLGPRWHAGAITLGVISHGSSPQSGHGPGVNVILTSASGAIEPIITRKANIGELLGLA